MFARRAVDFAEIILMNTQICEIALLHKSNLENAANTMLSIPLSVVDAVNNKPSYCVGFVLICNMHIMLSD